MSNSQEEKETLKKAYKTLELAEDASYEEVKKKYKKLVLLYHPDKYRQQVSLTNSVFRSMRGGRGGNIKRRRECRENERNYCCLMNY